MTFRPRLGRGRFVKLPAGSPRRAACSLAAGLAVSLAGAVARGAGGPSRVVIVREQGADPVVDRAEVRLAAELRAAGFEVEERAVEGNEDARQLVEEPGEDGPFATVLLRRAGGRAATDVWVADHITHKTVVRRFGGQGSDGSDRALALRIVELMRASLVEPLVLPGSDAADSTPPAGPAAPAPSPAPAPGPQTTQASPAAPPPDVVRWTREAIREPSSSVATHSVGLTFGFVGMYAGPDVAPAFGPALRVALHATPIWSVGVFAGTGFGGNVSAREGTAALRQDFGLVDLGVEIPSQGPLHVLGSLSAGAYHLFASGSANPGYTSLQTDTWTVLAAAGVGVRWHLTAAASLVFDARELVALVRPVIAFGYRTPTGQPASDRVAEAMGPGTLAGLSLAVDL